MIVDGCNNIMSHGRGADVPQFTVRVHKGRFVNNVIFIVKVNPVNLKLHIVNLCVHCTTYHMCTC